MKDIGRSIFLKHLFSFQTCLKGEILKCLCLQKMYLYGLVLKLAAMIGF